MTDYRNLAERLKRAYPEFHDKEYYAAMIAERRDAAAAIERLLTSAAEAEAEVSRWKGTARAEMEIASSMQERCEELEAIIEDLQGRVWEGE